MAALKETPRDISQRDAMNLIGLIALDSNVVWYVKWTCPACNERVVCEQANEFFNAYTHDDCSSGPVTYWISDPLELKIGLLILYTPVRT